MTGPASSEVSPSFSEASLPSGAPAAEATPKSAVDEARVSQKPEKPLVAPGEAPSAEVIATESPSAETLPTQAAFPETAPSQPGAERQAKNESELESETKAEVAIEAREDVVRVPAASSDSDVPKAPVSGANDASSDGSTDGSTDESKNESKNASNAPATSNGSEAEAGER